MSSGLLYGNQNFGRNPSQKSSFYIDQELLSHAMRDKVYEATKLDSTVEKIQDTTNVIPSKPEGEVLSSLSQRYVNHSFIGNIHKQHAKKLPVWLGAVV